MVFLVEFRNAFEVAVHIFVEIAIFWQWRLQTWWTRPSRKSLLLQSLKNATSFEEWEAAAILLDEIQGGDLWRQMPASRHYDYRLIHARLQSFLDARNEFSILPLIGHLRSGLVRNLGNITSTRLYNRAFAGTKILIEHYVTQVALAIEQVAGSPTDLGLADRGLALTDQAKLDLLHDTRQAFGRSAIVLQGGLHGSFGLGANTGPSLWQLGVVRALHLRGLLPKIVVGQGTSSFTAALIGVSLEAELLKTISRDSFSLTALGPSAMRGATHAPHELGKRAGGITKLQRSGSVSRTDLLLEARVLQQYTRDIVGDLTFGEAYAKTMRVLNITIPVVDGGDLPRLLNYITAPNIVSKWQHCG